MKTVADQTPVPEKDTLPSPPKDDPKPIVPDATAKPIEKPIAAKPEDKSVKPVADDAADPFAPAPATPVKPPETKPKADAVPSPDAVKPADAPVDDPFAPTPAKPAAKDSGSIVAPAKSIPVALTPAAVVPAVVVPAAPVTLAEPVALLQAAVAPKVEKAATTSAFATVPATGAVVENDPMRLWRDDSGEFEVRGKLVLILDGKVRLLKETGKYTTVPLDRLSPADLSYVRQHASAMLAKLTAQADGK